MDYKLFKSSRKTISLQVDKDGTLVVRAPLKTSRDEINRFILEKASWIEKQQKKQKKAALSIKFFTEDEIKEYTNLASLTLPGRCSAYADIIGVSYNKITIRAQRTRWGSCSAKGNLNFNCLLMLCPSAVIDYVIIHELCHLLELNHSKRFWDLVETAMPDYRVYRKWLKENGDVLLAGLIHVKG